MTFAPYSYFRCAESGVMLGGGGGRRFLWLRSRSRHAEPEIFDLNASAFTQNLLVEELSRRTTTGEAMIWKLEGNKQLENCTSSILRCPNACNGRRFHLNKGHPSPERRKFACVRHQKKGASFLPPLHPLVRSPEPALTPSSNSSTALSHSPPSFPSTPPRSLDT